MFLTRFTAIMIEWRGGYMVELLPNPSTIHHSINPSLHYSITPLLRLFPSNPFLKPTKLLEQQKFPGLAEYPCFQAVEIHPHGQICAVEDHPVLPGVLLPGDQGMNFLP